MRPRLYLCVSAALLGVVLAGAVARAAAATLVTGVRHWTAPDHTRIVLDLSAPPVFTEGLKSGPRTLVVRLDGTSIASGVHGFRVGDGVVREVALAPAGDDVEVLVLLEADESGEVFALEPYGEKPHRLVIDIPRSIPNGVDTSAAPAPPRARKIVIDPGHGGEDLGARGYEGTVEKKITLDMAMRIARRINESKSPDPEVRLEAVLTREIDEFVPLPRRVRIAQQAEADLFISVHANSSPDRSGHGVEVYFVSLSGATDVAAQELADSENAAHLIGGRSGGAEEELLASEDLLGILLDMTQAETIARSSDLAESVIESLRHHTRVPVRGVKQAGFQVLRSVVVPSILVEVGFVTNREEAAKLVLPEYRDRLADGIVRGVEAFLAKEAAGERLGVHVVAEGETLSGLAARHRIPVEDLARINGIAVGPLRVGQRIRVPR